MATISKDDVKKWQADAKKQPPPISERAAERLSNIRSFTVVTADMGMGLRMMTGAGDMADLLLNPVVARELMRAIGEAGVQGGWLTETLDLNVTP